MRVWRLILVLLTHFAISLGRDFRCVCFESVGEGGISVTMTFPSDLPYGAGARVFARAEKWEIADFQKAVEKGIRKRITKLASMPRDQPSMGSDIYHVLCQADMVLISRGAPDTNFACLESIWLTLDNP